MQLGKKEIGRCGRDKEGGMEKKMRRLRGERQRWGRGRQKERGGKKAREKIEGERGNKLQQDTHTKINFS
jgi:hypothetical protein